MKDAQICYSLLLNQSIVNCKSRKNDTEKPRQLHEIYIQYKFEQL